MIENLAKRLVEFRKFNNLSQEELATKLGVSRQSICNWESGEVSPSIDYLSKMADLYDVTIDDIVSKNDLVEDIYNKKKESKSKENKDEDKTIVHISKKGIFINDNEDKELKINFENNKEEEDIFNLSEEESIKYKNRKEKRRKLKVVANSLDGLFTLLTVVAYILLGIFLPNNLGWIGFWPLFILIGTPGQIIRAFAYKEANKFPIPQIVVATYLFLGLLLPNNSGWHPYWVIFFAIPLYYTIVNLFKDLRNKN